ncbi:VIT1/CCC1 transporter family protein [uncultured Methanoregula sp.]|uniref:VIT1/CCC1 transporter family protein n=1 Tax=uncultured Methanoregula sp. TaxID=1005933 RepID=UPI002AAC439B|nr:VIT1/CCC1 transporter family protein [uncultured Methanoregula sp.]
MPEKPGSSNQSPAFLALQKSEITEHRIYQKIAAGTKDPHNREVLNGIASEELRHYEIWKGYTKRDVAPSFMIVWAYTLAARILGITFTLKILERVEHRAQELDRRMPQGITELAGILENEERHERELIALIDEERLKYVGSVVLGLNDALVEFTGTLAGLTFAIQNSQIIAVAGLIMGVAASLSMAASEYLSQRSDAGPTDPFKASVYTGFTYIVTVALLILPFLVLPSPYTALVFTLCGAVGIIFLFTFYISVAKDLPFWRRFGEMAAISLGIAAISFVIGLGIRVFLNVNV